MDQRKASGKPFTISKHEVWDAWLKVKGNQGAPWVRRGWMGSRWPRSRPI